MVLFSKSETALVLATIVISMLLGTVMIGVGISFYNQSLVISQEQFDQAWQFSILFAGAALMYFGFRAGQTNDKTTAQQ